MDNSAAQNAISLALLGKWSESIDANLKILKENSNDTEALCRLTRAYSEIGKIKDAKETANKVLSIDPTNQIAIKFLEKLKHTKTPGKQLSKMCVESFLEEPGKTRMIELVNLGNPENLAGIDPGDEVKITTYSHRVSITSYEGKYLGRLPDDISARLKYMIKNGCKYLALVKSISHKSITVFIREIEKGPKLEGSASFPPEKIEYVSFTPPELVHKDTPDVESIEESAED